MGANKDVKETKQAAILLAEAMDRFRELFLETVRGKNAMAPPVSNEEWRRRKEHAYAIRMRAAAIAERLEARVHIGSPKMRRSPSYPFHLASQRGLARQLSAVDIMHLATTLLGAAEYEDDGDLAAATAKEANDLGAHALALVQVAPTLGFDEASFGRYRAVLDLVERSYQEAMEYHAEALATLNRLRT